MFWGHFSTDLGFKDKKLANIVWRLGGYPFPPCSFRGCPLRVHAHCKRSEFSRMCLQITPCVPVYVAFTTTVYLTTYDLHINLTLAKSDFLTVAIPFQLVQK